jgi:monovalent cation:proton antiporter-2 (CPA2) family protein
MTLLAQVGVFLAASVIAIPLFRKFRLSSVLGYLAAGIAIGPWGLKIVSETDGVAHIAEFGVVLLLFVIGLELQPSRLRAMRHAIFGLGASQVIVTTIVFAAVGWYLGLSLNTAFVVGFALSLSSTPLVLQLLSERGQLNTQQGRSGFAILLFQDIAVMPVIAILPMLGNTDATRTLSDSLFATGKALGVLVLLVFGGRHLLRPILRIVAETKVREAFTAAALLVVIGTSLLVSAVGLSMALGAFVAGLLLADSEFRHELEADIEPFKGLLLGLFFISVGMSANMGLLGERPVAIAALVVGLMVGKFALLWILGRMSKHDKCSSLGLAFALPQAGEFGFVLFTLAVSFGIMAQSLADMLVIVVTASMILSPILMSLQSSIIEPLFNKKDGAKEYDRINDDDSRVIISGAGRFGQVITRVLRTRKIRFTSLEADASQVENLRRFGVKVYYGDASRLDMLQAARADKAEVFILAIDDVEASVRTAEVLQKHYPHLKIFARARNRQHALRLMELNVHYIMRETFLSSLDVAQHALEALGLTRGEAVESIRRFRVIDERTLNEQLHFKDDEQKLIQNSKMVAKELDRLFEADETQTKQSA